MQDFGPRLPPHYVKRKRENFTNSKRSPVSDSIGASDAIGAGSDSDSSDDIIGPVPQHLLSQSKTKVVKPSKSVKVVHQVNEEDQVPKSKSISLLEQHAGRKSTKDPIDLNQIRNTMVDSSKREKIIQEAKSLDSKFTKEML